MAGIDRFLCGCPFGSDAVKLFDRESFNVCPVHGQREYGWRTIDRPASTATSREPVWNFISPLKMIQDGIALHRWKITDQYKQASGEKPVWLWALSKADVRSEVEDARQAIAERQRSSHELVDVDDMDSLRSLSARHSGILLLEYQVRLSEQYNTRARERAMAKKLEEMNTMS